MTQRHVLINWVSTRGATRSEQDGSYTHTHTHDHSENIVLIIEPKTGKSLAYQTLSPNFIAIFIFDFASLKAAIYFLIKMFEMQNIFNL